MAGHSIHVSGGLVSSFGPRSSGSRGRHFRSCLWWGAEDLDGAKKISFGTALFLFLVSHPISLFMMDLILAATFAGAAYSWAVVAFREAAVVWWRCSRSSTPESGMRDGDWRYEELNRPVQLYRIRLFPRIDRLRVECSDFTSKGRHPIDAHAAHGSDSATAESARRNTREASISQSRDLRRHSHAPDAAYHQSKSPTRMKAPISSASTSDSRHVKPRKPPRSPGDL